jgi:hypothetical protein
MTASERKPSYFNSNKKVRTIEWQRPLQERHWLECMGGHQYQNSRKCLSYEYGENMKTEQSESRSFWVWFIAPIGVIVLLAAL